MGQKGFQPPDCGHYDRETRSFHKMLLTLWGCHSCFNSPMHHRCSFSWPSKIRHPESSICDKKSNLLWYTYSLSIAGGGWEQHDQSSESSRCDGTVEDLRDQGIRFTLGGPLAEKGNYPCSMQFRRISSTNEFFPFLFVAEEDGRRENRTVE